MRLVCSLLASLLFVASHASAEISGSWSGTYTAMATACQPAVPHGGTGRERVADDQRVVHRTANGNVFSGSFPSGPATSGTISGNVQGRDHGHGHRPIGMHDIEMSADASRSMRARPW